MNTYFGYDRAIFDRVITLGLRKIRIIAVSVIFFALVAHIEMIFGIHRISSSSFGYKRAIFDRVMALGPRKITIIGSFRAFSSQRLHILK
jgi:hypothetical protein